MNLERELRTIVIDGKLPVAEITKQYLEATANGCGVAISFDDAQDNEPTKNEINAAIDRFYQIANQSIHDDPSFPNEAIWIMPDTDERRYLTLDPRPNMANRQVRRAKLADQRRGKW